MTDPECSWLFDAGASLVAAASAAIDALDLEAEPIQTLVSMGPPVAEFRCDRVSAYLISLGPDAPSLARMQQMSGCSWNEMWPSLLARFEVQYWTNCFPGDGVVNDTIIPPSLEALTAASVTLYTSGLAAYMGLLGAQSEGFPSMPSVIDKVLVGALAPLGPQGNAAGWRIPIEVSTN